MPEIRPCNFANIFLVGYRCTGKSMTGIELSRRLSLKFVDTDELVEKKAGKCVSEIVSDFGWETFRKMETGILCETAKNSGFVAATGGGVILDPANAGIMRKTGIVIWLCASAATIISRMTRDAQTQTLRPALSDAPFEEEVRQTLDQRLSLYEKASDFCVLTDNIDISETCDEIVKILRSEDARKFIRKDI